MSALRQVPNIKDLVEKYNIDTFVETGVDFGDGLRYADYLGIKYLYSCDIDQANAYNAQNMGLARNGFVYWGKSTRFLEACLHMWAGHRCLFWLDAHFPRTWSDDPKIVSITERDVIWPVARELDLLRAKQGIDRDVVIVDDLCVVQSDDNITWREGQDPYCTVQGITIADLVSKLPLAHVQHKVDTGILVMEPR